MIASSAPCLVETELQMRALDPPQTGAPLLFGGVGSALVSCRFLETSFLDYLLINMQPNDSLAAIVTCILNFVRGVGYIRLRFVKVIWFCF